MKSRTVKCATLRMRENNARQEEEADSGGMTEAGTTQRDVYFFFLLVYFSYLKYNSGRRYGKWTI